MLNFSGVEKVPYRYGLDELPYDIAQRELLYFFSLTPEEKNKIMIDYRPPVHCIAIGIQLGAYRFIGRAQSNLERTPPVITQYITNTLNIGGGFIPLESSSRERTRREHAQIAREFLGLSHFPLEDHKLLATHLIQNAPDPGNTPAWIKCAEDFLRAKRYVLPSIKTLRRLILSARHRSIENVMACINSQMTDECRDRLETMLESQDDKIPFWNSLINKNIYSATPAKLSDVLDRIKGIRELALKEIDFNNIPYHHIKHLARCGMNKSAHQLKDYLPLHCHAIMTATARELESELTDVVIQMNDEILAGVFQRGRQRSEKYLRQYRKIVHQVVSAFRFISDTILDRTLPEYEMITRIVKKIPLEKMQKLKEETDFIDIPRGSESLYFASQGHNTIQKYLPLLLETFKIVSSSRKDPVIEAAHYYAERRRQEKKGIGQDAPTGFVQETRWKRIVFDAEGRINAKPWVLCLSERLRRSFRQGALEIDGARQYRSLNSDLIPWEEWNTEEWERSDKIPFTFLPEQIFDSLSCAVRDFSKTLHRSLGNETPPATIDEKNRLHFTKLDKIEEPDSVKELRNLIQKQMPQRSLPDVLAETDRLVGYSRHFTRLSTGHSMQQESESIGQSLYALLLASACNISLAKIATSIDLPDSTLESIREDVFRPQTLQDATSVLVDFHSRLPLAQLWGGGETSSSDGQGLVAAGHPLGAVYHRRRFGAKRKGFIVYTHISDNYAPFYTQVIPASVREATYVLDGLLYHGSSLMPREHYTDSHGYTDVVFAFTYLLGFRLAPRMAKIPDLTLWYGTGYEAENENLFKGKISPHKIADQWEAMQRIVKTIESGKTRASQIIRKISAFSRKHPLFKAFRNLGRLVRTRHILEVAGDKEYRRRILQGLNKCEQRNALASEIRYARRGIVREKDPEMQLSVISSINLAVLCLSIWNTIHMQRAIRSLAEEGYAINKEDLRFLSPFGYAHINLYGHFSFQPLPKFNSRPAEKDFAPLW